MKQPPNAQVDELYRLPLEEFTRARNTLAKSLSGSEKKQIVSLVKPALPMWAINQLFWQDAPTYKALVDASEKLRAAHRSALSGRKVETRTLDQLHRTTVEKAFARTIGLAEKRGVRLTDTVRETVRRTLAALPGDEPAGRLTRAPAPAGFSLLTGVKIRPESKVESPQSRVESPESGVQSPKSKVESQESKVALRRAELERKEAERKARQEQKAREKREREVRKAEQALRDAQRRLAELKGS